MRWNACVAGLAVVVTLLIAPLAAQAESLRANDAPPLEGAPAATTASVPADPPPEQVVTIYVPSEPAQNVQPTAKPKPKQPEKASAEPAPPPPPPAPPAPPAPPIQPGVSAPSTDPAPPPESPRGGASSPVAVPPPARGGPSVNVPVAQSRHTASAVTNVLASGGGVTSSPHGEVSRAVLAVLAAAAFTGALLITRMLCRRRLGDAAGT
jgi:hypothetical protein